MAAAALYRTIRLAGGSLFWAIVGTSLVMTSYGVWYFANGEVHHVALAILLVIFGGDTHALIPLYAVGVFLSFTLSQASMVRRWLRLKEEGWWWRWWLNAIGALVTGLVMITIAAVVLLPSGVSAATKRKRTAPGPTPVVSSTPPPAKCTVGNVSTPRRASVTAPLTIDS